MLNRSLLAAAILFVAAFPVMAEDAPPAPVKAWNTSFGAGLATTRGNTDTKNINLSFSTKYDPKQAFVFKAEALYLRGDTDGVTQVDKASALTRGEYTLSPRTFTFAEISYLRDPFKDLDYMLAPMVGAGYRIVSSETRNLTVDGAAGGEFEKGSTGSSSGTAVKAGESFDWAFTKTSKFTQRVSGIWKTEDFEDALYHFDIGLTTSVATRVDLKLAYILDYKNITPSPDVKKGDSAFVVAAVLKF